MFNFTPLLGAQSASAASQSLLEFDGGIKVLIDAGWDESFDVEKLKEMEKHVPTLSFILLTHATTAHLGAFAHCCKHFPLFTRIPVYATIPVIALGRTLLQDLYASTPLASSIIPLHVLTDSAHPITSYEDGHAPNILLQAPTPEEIASYFSLINPLKYSQPHQPLPSSFSPPLNGLTITAYSAGHTLGGTIWHIQHGMESVVYAVDWNQAREHVLSGAAWLGGSGADGSEVLEQLRRPTAMICSSKRSGPLAIAGQRNKRDDTLLSMIRDTVGNGGSVLIPSDSSARVLELAYLLEETWRKETSTRQGTNQLKNVKVYLAIKTGGATMRNVLSLQEWMDEGIVKEFETKSAPQVDQDQNRSRGQQRGGAKAEDDKAAKPPFDFRHITILEKKSRVMRMLRRKEPRVIIASDTSMEWGFSKDAIKSLASDERNLIILTERAGETGAQVKGLGRHLWELWNERSESSRQDPVSTAVVSASGHQTTMQSTRTVPLEGNELSLYQQYLAKQRQLHQTEEDELVRATTVWQQILDDNSQSSPSSEDEEDFVAQGKPLSVAYILGRARTKNQPTEEELGPTILIRNKGVQDYYTGAEKGRRAMFPFEPPPRRREDDYGEELVQGEFETKENDDDGVTKRRKVDETTTSGPGEDPESSDSEPEENPDKVEGPSKVILGTETLQLNCQISFVDFSGLHDRRTIQMLVPLIRPRKLILIAGEEAETNELAEECHKVLNAGAGEAVVIIDVFTPTVGMVIDASVDTNAWMAKLSRGILRKLQWQQVRGLGVVAITGKLAAASLEPSAKQAEGGAKKKVKLETAAPEEEEKMDTTPILDVVPTNMATAIRSVAQPFHVGDLRLADLRKIMQSSGMTAEFRGEGVLVINGTVSVRKTATGRIEVDGGAYSLADVKTTETSSFWQVKKKIYDGLAVVGGGAM
ncbi:hypothetical protein K505DRAFT_297840 [Melanomma pulvis-pyrius CBS 109.77]|uniref:Cleavage and polyadenylation specificity factor subunit 2 n=1 Tax=Melanomma pulvis-pyrius CBS 109.77 TaxID=1314802 RepID=A0A6A6XNF1_9PLEO|nr:hypothetical protein K505DRAFT_297840 [Melanomma pulvis-pyrius CBS 109.77]